MITQDLRNTLAGWDFSADEINASCANGIMLNPSIDLTNACNLNCPYCYIEEKQSLRKVRKPDELSYEEHLAIIDDLRTCGARTINIVGAGEPSIDPHFIDIIKYIHAAGMRTVLFTNGIRITHELNLPHFLYSHGVSIVLKYNSRNHSVQDLAAGSNGYTEKRDKALDLLLDAGFRAQEPTRLAIDAIAFRGNVAELLSIHRWCREENIFPIVGDYIPTGRTEMGRFEGHKALVTLPEGRQTEIEFLLQPITESDRQHLVASMAAIDSSLGISRSVNFAYLGGGICTQILGLYIDILGNIWPCVARKQRMGAALSNGLLGNTRSGSLASAVWKSDPYISAIRQSFDGGCPYKPPLISTDSLKGRTQ